MHLTSFRPLALGAAAITCAVGLLQPAVAQETFRGVRQVATQKAVINFRALARQRPGPRPATGLRETPYPGGKQTLPVPSHALGGSRVAGFDPPGGGGDTEPNVASPGADPSFEGIVDNQTVIPPDTHGAVGPNHVMTVLNTEFRIESRTGVDASTVTIDAFWASTGATGCFDPKALYDPYGQRWMVTACSNSRNAASSLLIGVSQTSDPTGTWNLYRKDFDASDTVWADYPSMGFNKNWIVVNMNRFTNAADAFDGSDVYVFDKADLYAGGAGNVTVLNNGGAAFGGTQVPAITMDPDLDTIHLLQNWNGNPGDGNGYLRHWTVTGAVGAEVLTAGGLVSTANPWTSNHAITNGGFAPQLDTTTRIMCNDARMQNVVYRNGSLWAAHTVFLPAGAPTRCAAQWWQINPATDAVQQFGRVDDGTGAKFYAFPSIAVNKNSDVLLGYSRFAANQYASANYSFRYAGDAAGTMRDDTVLKAGEARYAKSGGGRVRWGDYSSTVVDPLNDYDMWTIQEFARTRINGDATSVWSTWWGRVRPDTIAPTVSFTSPTRAAYLRSLSSITGTSSDNTDGSGVASLIVRLRRAPGDGSPIAGKYWNGTGWQDGVFDLAVSGLANWNVTTALPSDVNLPDGGYFVIAYPSDGAGNLQYQGIRFVVDATAPTLAFTSPTNGQPVTDLATITGTASDSGVGVRLVLVRIKQANGPGAADDKWWKPGVGFVSGEAPVLATDNAASWSVTDARPAAGDMPPGTYQLYGYGFDKLGNRRDIVITVTKS